MNCHLSRLILFTFLFSGTLSAEESIPSYYRDSIPSYVGQEIVIESFKQNRGLYLEPISATLLSAKEIKQMNVVNMKEFSGYIPNLYMPDYGSKMTSPVYIRGIGSRINAPSIALYIDGVPYFDRATFDFNLSDVSEVEVLRGSQGTIYGRNTMGGVINVYTKSPLNYQETNIYGTAGSHNQYKIGASHYGKINTNLGYSFSVNYGHAGGFYKNKFKNKKADPIDEVAARGRLMWRANRQLLFDLTLAYEYSDQDGYPYRLYNVKEQHVNEVNYNRPSYYRRTMSTNGLHIAYITEDFKLSSQSAFQFFDGKQGLDQDFSEHDLYYVDFYHRQQMYSEEINIKSLNEDSWYKWQFGAFGFHQNTAQNNDVEFIQMNDVHQLQKVYNPTWGLAVYHQSTISRLGIENLSFDFGIRYDFEKTTSTLYKQPKDPHKDGIAFKKRFSQVTPKFSLNYRFQNNGITYFSVTRGYKTGGFNNTAEFEKEHTFDPEYSWTYELGSKSSFFDNLLHLDLSLFWIDWRDQQVSQRKTTADGGGLAKNGQILRNAGKSESKGIEFTAQLNAIQNFEMQLSYGFTHAKYKDYNNGEEDDKLIIYNGNYLPLVPQNTFSLSAGYTIVVNNKYLDDIHLNAQYVGLGPIYWNDGNSVKQSFYDLLNAKLGFRKGKFLLEFWAKNMTNKRYISYHFTMMNNMTKETDNFVQQGKPFHCGVDVNFSF